MTMAKKLQIKQKCTISLVIRVQVHRYSVGTNKIVLHNFQFIRASNRCQINGISCILLFYTYIVYVRVLHGK